MAAGEADLRKHERVEQELQVVPYVQQTLLPDALPASKGWQFQASYLPANEVSGISMI